MKKGTCILKQQLYQQFVYKIPSEKILDAKKRNLIITPSEARVQNLIVSLADNQVFRTLDRLNGVDRDKTAAQIKSIREKLKTLTSGRNRNERQRLYAELDEMQLKRDFVMVIMSKPSDFDKINKGFKINGIEFKRLVGTTNGVKKSTVIYCSVINDKGIHIYDELDRVLNGGRDVNKELIPAKFEAYKSLACSSTIPVSKPLDVLVVNDFVLNVRGKYTQISDGVISDEPVVEERNGEVELNASDGFGLMLPSLAERWSTELGLDYTAPGMCIRNLFCKGMVFTFDFKEFANRYYNSDTITDVWGTVHKIENIELILPVSVMKLWDSYDSLEHYLKCCDEFHHTFAVTKTCDKELENEHTLNYQFIQSYELTDDEIYELISPTINEIKETICGDPDKTILYLHGAFPKKYKFDKDENYLVKAIMLNPELAKDPYVISTVTNMIKKKIKELKIGKCNVHGNYAMISGDPFAFCQSIFGCDVPDEEKGLLKAGEIYSKFWADQMLGFSKKVACFRAPMSLHANIRVMNVVRDDEIDYWYQYMETVNIINVHDFFCPALSGCDFDGDQSFTTDNSVLLRKWRNDLPIMCIQQKAQKSVVTEDNLAQSNKNGFGDEIGTITNRITSMYDILTRFPKNSEQYKTLEYRIMCGQQYQQSAIDKIKGIITKPMPKEWYDTHSVKITDEDDPDTAALKEKNREIIADKKPYFMTYVYDTLSSKYKKVVDNAEAKVFLCLNIHLNELLDKDPEELSDLERKLTEEYYKNCPITDDTSTMNRLCHAVEDEFRGYKPGKEDKKTNFAQMMMSESETRINTKDKKALTELYKKFRDEAGQLRIKSDSCDKKEIDSLRLFLREEFYRKALDICPDPEQLCDALLEICYKSSYSKRFVWDLCGEQIVKNLLKRNKKYCWLLLDNENGEIEYHGNRYRKMWRELEESCDGNEDYNE